MKVRVGSFDLARKSFTERGDGKRIEWSDSSDRKWLMNHLHWAMNNGVEITLSPESN